ncbi:MAG: MOSC domain-containing protein [Myxococcota bacterium]
MTPLKELMRNHARPGRVHWIGLRPARKQPLVAVQSVLAQANRGLEGDHTSARVGAKRQVTLVQREHLEVVARLVGLETVDPGLLRRNIVVEAVNLFALRKNRFRIGEAIFEGTELCHPCSRMESALGFGGYNAMRGHGGIIARVVESGRIGVGDSVEWLEGAETPQLH